MTEENGSRQEARRSSVRVLLVEDNPGDSELIRAHTEEERHRPMDLSVCRTLAEALGTIASARPDIILLDLGLPDSNGIETFVQVRDQAGDTPIIIFSGRDDVELAERCMEMGAQDYLVKGRADSFIAGAIYNTAARAAAQKALSEATRRLNLATDLSDVGLWEYFPTEDRVFLSAVWKRQLGFEPDALPSAPSSWEDRLHPEDRAPTLAYLESYLASGGEGPYECVFRLQHRDGSYRWILARGGALSREEGRVTHMLGCHIDITERKRLECDLAQADRLSSMGMLAAGVAHEINNPLAYVLYNLESMTEDLPGLIDALRALQARRREAGAQTAASDKDPILLEANPALLDDLRDRFEEALSGTRRIRDIARGLNTFSRVERDQVGPVDLKHVIEVALNLAFNEIKYRARLVKDYGQAPTVLASEGRLAQVFLNLIINAAHAIEEGDVENNEIRVRTWAEDGAVCAEVQDSGCGIPAENLPDLFEPFFTTKKIGVGSGLGLAISKSIVEGYGGSIAVQSDPGSGTRFLVRLPTQAEQDEAVEAQRRQAKPPAAAGRILIVDDEANIRRVLGRILGHHETVGVDGGGAALRLLEQDQAFDLVLCDMMMPDVSGMDLHRWLRENNPRLARQLIFITGGAFTPLARAYLAEVGNIRLEKPFEQNNVRKIVDELIRAAQTSCSD